MHRVHSDNIFDILPLFDFDFPNQTALLSCANGEIPGEFYVNDPTIPTACVAVIGFYNWTFIGGGPEQDWLNHTFAILQKDRFLMLIWAEWVTSCIQPPPEFTQTINRYEFLDSPLTVVHTDSRLAPDQRLNIVRMDQELFSRCLWNSEMTLAYGCHQSFLDFGLGFCLMRGNEICCEVYAVFRAKQRYEIGVITPEAYRGLGYAYKACSFLSKQCAREGFKTSWSCNQENNSSVGLARKLGYKIEREYQMLHYPVQRNK
ncbi:hypothetical protein BH11VER1_BH11VER1_09230 [soil metagenome]